MLAAFLVLIIVIYLQYQDSKKLKIEIGNTYLIEVRNVLALTSDYNTKYSFLTKSDFTPGSTELFYEYSYKYIDASLEISRINSQFTTLSDKLHDIGNNFRLLENQPELASKIKKDIKDVNEYLIYINENIPDKELEWFKELKSSNSKLIQKANLLID